MIIKIDKKRWLERKITNLLSNSNLLTNQGIHNLDDLFDYIGNKEELKKLLPINFGGHTILCSKLYGTINSFPPGYESGLKTIAIDFDGVIHNDHLGYHDGTVYGDPIPGSLDALASLASKYRIVIFTAKAKPDRPRVNGLTGAQLVWEWLENYGVDKYVYEVTSEKPRAFLYIDDNGYRFNNWKDAIQFVDTITTK